jgi:hypothetical protein
VATASSDKVILEQAYAHSFMNCLWLLLQLQSLISFNKDQSSAVLNRLSNKRDGNIIIKKRKNISKHLGLKAVFSIFRYIFFRIPF